MKRPPVQYVAKNMRLDLQLMSEMIAPNSRVLDIGSGDGSLIEHLFRTRDVNLHVFHGRFRRKVSVALLFMAFAGVILLSADIASYSGERLVREATMDVVATIVGTLFMVFWINHALSRPVARLDLGMRLVAKGDYQVRLPVTSDDEMGHAAGRFNEMVEGLAERRDAPERLARVVRARGGGRERRQVRLAHAFAVADTHLPNALRFVPHSSSNPALSSLRCALQVWAALTRSSVVSSVVSWTFCETHLP